MNRIAAVQTTVKGRRGTFQAPPKTEGAATKERRERKDHSGVFYAIFAFFRDQKLLAVCEGIGLRQQ